LKVWHALVVALAIGAAVAPLDAPVVERWYSVSLYPTLQRLVTPVSNLFPFAWFDLVTMALAVLFLTLLLRVVGRAREGEWRFAFRTLAHLVTAAAVVYLAFLSAWGLNYRRVPMTERLVLDREPPTSSDVLALGLSAVEKLNELHSAAHKEGWRTAPWRDRPLRQAAAAVQGILSDAAPAVPGRLKWSIYGPYFRWANVDGMVNPLGLEVIGNPDLLPFERPFVAAHEWAHLAGYAGEAEASFVGWLTCVRAGASAAYSGWLFLYWQINSEIGAADRKRLAASLGPGPREDIAAINARLTRGEIPILREASWRVYDQYLKANRVERGIRNYGAVITLILRARFEENWTPVRQPVAGSR
jgi:hypothetical protein